MGDFTNIFGHKANKTGLVNTSELSEKETFDGHRFYAEYDKSFNSGEVKYVLYQMPSTSSGKIIALQQRQFKTESGGAEIEILWDSTGLSTGSSIPSFNENRLSSSVATMAINELTTPPATAGTIRERDFIPSAGNVGQSSGGINSDLGFRLYNPDSFFVLKITNTHAKSQRIHVAYTWFEMNESEI